jgi:hypothetical protein
VRDQYAAQMDGLVRGGRHTHTGGMYLQLSGGACDAHFRAFEQNCNDPAIFYEVDIFVCFPDVMWGVQLQCPGCESALDAMSAQARLSSQEVSDMCVGNLSPEERSELNIMKIKGSIHEKRGTPVSSYIAITTMILPTHTGTLYPGVDPTIYIHIQSIYSRKTGCSSPKVSD